MRMPHSQRAALLAWGGNRNSRTGALPYLSVLHSKKALVDYLDAARRAFALDGAFIDAGRPQAAKMNSMLTKVHALASADGLPIYDSRVAAAIAALVELWRRESRMEHAPLPRELVFPATMSDRSVLCLFDDAQEPGLMSYAPDKAAETAARWSSAKIRFGWLMSSILEKAPGQFVEKEEEDRMHAFEASLFMIGYDVACLSANRPGAVLDEKQHARLQSAGRRRLRREHAGLAHTSISTLKGDKKNLEYAGDVDTGISGVCGPSDVRSILSACIATYFVAKSSHHIETDPVWQVPGPATQKENVLMQTTMEQATSAPYLLRELTELGNLVFGMFAGPQVTVRHWPAYYRVYLEVDGLCREVNRLAGYLARGFIDADGTVDADRIMDANACFAQVDGTVAAITAIFADVVRDRLVISGNPALVQIVDRLFAPDSQWYYGVQVHYRSGQVAPDGRTLARTVLPIDPCPAAGLGGEAAVERQQFELAPEYTRTLNGRTTRRVQTALNQVYAALGEIFVRRCTSVGALLHPRSTPRAASMGCFYSTKTLEEEHESIGDLPGGLAVYVSRDHTFATIGAHGVRPADGKLGLIVHVRVDLSDDDPAKREPRVTPAIAS